MKAANIHSKRKKAFRVTTNSRHSLSVSQNLLNRNFSFSAPNQAWVGDITYIKTAEGWLYLAAVKDLCTKKIVGYAFSKTIDSELTKAALAMAIRRQRPPKGLVFHSDRGVQYASATYRELLAQHHIVQSMSRKGDPYDNAVAENFFSCLKCELVHLCSFTTRRHAQNEIFAYIEAFYNNVRPHSSIGWLSPNEFENRFFDPLAA